MHFVEKKKKKKSCQQDPSSQQRVADRAKLVSGKALLPFVCTNFPLFFPEGGEGHPSLPLSKKRDFSSPIPLLTHSQQARSPPKKKPSDKDVFTLKPAPSPLFIFSFPLHGDPWFFLPKKSLLFSPWVVHRLAVT